LCQPRVDRHNIFKGRGSETGTSSYGSVGRVEIEKRRLGGLQVGDDGILGGNNGAVRGLQLFDGSVVGRFELLEFRRVLCFQLACPVVACPRNLHQRLGVLFPAGLLGCQGGLERGDALRL
jgi:hypothetical protein